MEKFFYKLSFTSTVSDSLKNIVCSNNLSFRNVYGFDLLNLSKYIFVKESKLFSLICKFKGVPLVIKMEPMTFYNWHKDANRQCTINMIIENTQSYCLFGEPIDDNNTSITELIYKPSTYYLFNTQAKHSVLNLAGTRYLLSIGFDNNSYDEILEYCRINDI